MKRARQSLVYFAQLGARVDRAWRATKRDEAQFSKIAVAALAALPAHEHVRADAIVKWVLSQPRLPEQPGLHANFGQPAVTVFASEHFYIDVYYWLDGTTAIHQHRFDGAFTVLAGSSLHSTYRFASAKSVTPRMLLGQLRLLDSELLTVGDIRPIVAGRTFVHALFHLDRPSVSVVVRTRSNVAAGPQFSYAAVLATDPFASLPVTLDLQLQTLKMLARSDARAYAKHLRALLSRADVENSWHLLEQAWRTLSPEAFTACLQSTRKRFPTIAPRFVHALEQQRRQDALVLRRTSVHDAELRYFLALLLNIPARARILALVKARYPRRDPQKTIVQWILSLWDIRVLNQNRRPFGSEDFWFYTRTNILRTPELQAAIASLVSGKRMKKNALTKQIRQSELLQPLFA